MRRKPRAILRILLPAAVFVGIPGRLVYRDIRRDRIDAALVAAVKERNVAEAMAQLRQGADPNAREKTYRPRSLWEHVVDLFDPAHRRQAHAERSPSALALAVSEDCTPIALALLDRGAHGVDEQAEWSPFARETYKDPLLVIAAFHGNADIVRGLLEHGALPNARGKWGEPALMLANCLLYGDQAPGKRDRTWPAAAARCTAITRLLLEHGAGIPPPDEGGSALYIAVQANLPASVELLLANGADPNETMFRSPLQRAVENGNLEIAKALLSKGARVRDANYPPLCYASDLTLLRFLLDHGADIHAHYIESADGRADDGKTTLIKWAGRNELDAVRLLLSRGADIKEHTFNGTTALMQASLKAHPAMVRYLLDHGSVINARDKTGRTALDFAAHNPDRGVAALLKRRGGK